MTKKTRRKPSNARQLENRLKHDARQGKSFQQLSTNGVSHTRSEHIDVTDEYIIDRLLTEFPSGGAMSQFKSTQAARQSIAAIVYANARQIAALGKTTRKHEFACHLGDVALPTPRYLTGIMRDPTTNALFEVKTDSAMLVLVNNPIPGSPYQISDLSAYPCVLPHASLEFEPVTTKTTRSLLKTVKNTNYYQTASFLQKAYLERCCSKRHVTASSFDVFTSSLTIEVPRHRLPKMSKAIIHLTETNDRIVTMLLVESVRTSQGQAPARGISETPIISSYDWERLVKRFPTEGKMAQAIIARSIELMNMDKKIVVHPNAHDILFGTAPNRKG